MYKTTHFRIEELVPPQVFKDRSQKAFELFNPNLLITIDKLRDRYGRMTINNWLWNGSRLWSGFRTADSPYFSQYSQHTLGNAVDIIFHDITAEQARQDILDDPDHDDFILITAFEEDTSWLHIDFRNTTRIKTFPIPK